MTDWKEKVDAAYDIVHALCQPRGSEGSREWTMSIPARPDHDPDLVITSGLRSATKEIHAITAERDRLAAENAELLQACDDFSKELSVQYQLELEAKCHDDLEKSHAIMVQVVAERDAEIADEKALTMFVRNELAAANATLDRLREVVPENDIRCPLCDSINSRYWGHGQWLCMGCEKKFGPFILIDKIRRAIYPPETPNDDR